MGRGGRLAAASALACGVALALTILGWASDTASELVNWPARRPLASVLVTVPAAARGGDVLQVAVPGFGQHLAVRVPPGVTGGQVLEFRLGRSAGLSSDVPVHRDHVAIAALSPMESHLPLSGRQQLPGPDAAPPALTSALGRIAPARMQQLSDVRRFSAFSFQSPLADATTENLKAHRHGSAKHSHAASRKDAAANSTSPDDYAPLIAGLARCYLRVCPTT